MAKMLTYFWLTKLNLLNKVKKATQIVIFMLLFLTFSTFAQEQVEVKGVVTSDHIDGCVLFFFKPHRASSTAWQ